MNANNKNIQDTNPLDQEESPGYFPDESPNTSSTNDQMPTNAVPIPNFGENTGVQGDSLSGRKMCFICSKGNLDMAYPGLIMANAALGEGAQVDIFFTFWGLDIVTKRTMDSLKFTMTGNTAMHMPALERIRPGWGKRYIPPVLGLLPGMTHWSTNYMNEEMDKIGIPPIRDMIEQIHEMGANMWACKLTADMMALKPVHLHSAVNGIIDATQFIEISEGAQIVFI